MSMTRNHKRVQRSLLRLQARNDKRSVSRAASLFNQALRSNRIQQAHLTNRRALLNLLLSYRVCRSRDATGLVKSANAKHTRFRTQDERLHANLREARPSTLAQVKALARREDLHAHACLIS